MSSTSLVRSILATEMPTMPVMGGTILAVMNNVMISRVMFHGIGLLRAFVIDKLNTNTFDAIRSTPCSVSTFHVRSPLSPE